MIKLKDIINEILSDWKSDVWVHYTNVPYIKINPKQAHGDPSGIYLFPSEFKPKADYWAIKKYSFYVKLSPDIKILDLSNITAKQAEDILHKIIKTPDKLGDIIPRMYAAEKGEDKYNKTPSDPFWEFLKNYFGGHYSEWNASFRKLGYDAIFDDSKAIHTMEPQMLVLNPTKIRVVKMETRKGSGYEYMIKVAHHIKDMMKDYKGYWHIGKPKKNSYGKLEIFMMFSNLPDKEWENEKYRDVTFNIYVNKKEGENVPPHEIYVSFGSTPRKSYGIGAKFSIIDQSWSDVNRLKKEIDDALRSPVKYKEG